MEAGRGGDAGDAGDAAEGRRDKNWNDAGYCALLSIPSILPSHITMITMMRRTQNQSTGRGGWSQLSKEICTALGRAANCNYLRQLHPVRQSGRLAGSTQTGEQQIEC